MVETGKPTSFLFVGITCEEITEVCTILHVFMVTHTQLSSMLQIDQKEKGVLGKQ